MDLNWSFLPVTVLCTVHLFIGALLGHMFTASQSYTAGPPAAVDPTKDVRGFQAALDGILRQAQHLSSSSAQTPQLPASLLDAIARLLEGIGALHNQVRGKSPPEAELSDVQLQALIEATSASAVDDPDCNRRPYDVLQYVADWTGDVPGHDEFQEVHCSDLSATGISFFTHELPSSHELVVTLGHEQEILMVARVMNHRRVQHYGRYCYLVGCRFIKRLDRTVAWPEPELAADHQVNAVVVQATAGL